MSSTNTQRTGRANKDRGNKSQNTQAATKGVADGTKATDGFAPKIQPTAEQLRIAQIINDANKSDDPDLKHKVEQIIELTGKSSDAVTVALHDCDNDIERATIMLLEGDQNEGEWEMSGKKKKNRQQVSTQKVAEVNGHDTIPENKEEREYVETRKWEPKQREGSRYRGPPRLSRGGSGRNWHNKENEKNERNLQDSRRERSSDGRPRARRGRGRGGGRSRTFQNRGLSNDGFPQSIDTWTNSTAEQVDSCGGGDAAMTMGNWSDFTAGEDWSEEDWTGSLNETKVFTPSTSVQSNNMSVEGPTSSVTQNLDLATLLQKAASSQDASQSNLTTNGLTAQPSQHSVLGSQSLSSAVAQPVQQSQAHFDFSQFAKQAAESIKAAVGVGSNLSSQSAPSMNASYHSSYVTNSSAGQPQVQIPRELQQGIVTQSYSSNSASGQTHVQMSRELQQPVTQNAFTTTTVSGQPHVQLSREPQQSVVSQQSQQPNSASHTKPAPQQQGLPPRSKSQRARLPPPSKIPESAVVMPDDVVTSLDVQFGALQFGTDSSSFDFASSESSFQDMGTSTASSHVLHHSSSNVPSSASLSTTLTSSSLNKEASYHVSGHGASSADSSTGKELGQSSSIGQAQKVAGQESILLASQTDHSLSNEPPTYGNHRSSQSTLESTLGSNKPDTTSLSSYGNSAHENASTYPGSYAGQKATVLASSNHASSTTSYTNPNSSLSSVNSELSNSQSQNKYGTNSQNQNSSYVSGSTTYGIQQSVYSGSATTAGSTYPSQSGYSSHTTSSYGSGNSNYSNHQGYSGTSVISTQPGTLHSSSGSSKLSGSLTHGVKDSILEATQNSGPSYDSTITTTTSGLTATLPSASASASNHSNQNSVLGLVSTSSSTTTTSAIKNSLSATGKAVPNIPPGVPAMLGHQYIMGQAGLPFYGLQQPVYSYEDMQMLQSKLTTLGYYDMQFQAATSLTGRDPGLGSVAYTTDGKYSRADTDAASVATSMAQGQTSTQTHGQAFLNPAALPPGYGYYFAGGMMAGGIHHYAPPIFPVPPATNAHGATTNTQFQKASAYGSHSYSSGYEGLTQNQDFTKGTYGVASQNQVKLVSGGNDLSASVYNKTHAQLAKSYDKPGFHTGTPPPFNIPGNQTAGPLGASSAPYATQFIPVLAHGQHHSTLLHHHLQQDSAQTGGTPAGGQRGPQALGQQKGANKQNFSYWNSN